MAYCKNCGALIDVDSKFCGVCGQKIVPIQTKNDSRKTTYDGNIHKCPNCGAILSSFLKNCPECGYELRTVETSTTVKEFAEKYVSTSIDKDKIALIRSFVVPNTKEDILEFVILSSSNINRDSYVKDSEIGRGGVTKQELNEAWMTKLEQAYQKAQLLLFDTPEFGRIESIYIQKSKDIKSYRKIKKSKDFFKNRTTVVVAIILICLSVSVFLGFKLSSSVDFNGSKALAKQVAEVESLIDLEDYSNALIKAYQMDYSTADKAKARTDLIVKILHLQGGPEGKIKVPTADVVEKQYEDIKTMFEYAGFLNVTTENASDMFLGILYDKGMVIEVSINGNTNFSANDYYEPSVPIKIRYHGR